MATIVTRDTGATAKGSSLTIQEMDSNFNNINTEIDPVLNYSTTKPTLDLNFVTKKLDPRVTFVRASSATYYDGVTVAKAEENLLTYSERFDNGAWTKSAGWAAFGSGSVANTTATTDPLGGNTADLLLENTSNAAHNFFQSFTYSSGSSYTFSIYVKLTSGSTRYVWLYFPATVFGADQQANFNLSDGTYNVISGTAAIYACTLLSNGWARISISATATISTFSNSAFAGTVTTLGGASSTYTGDGTSGIYIWGAQLEQRSSVTAYTPTTTTPITNYVPRLLIAPANTPRFQHNPTTGESLGFLVEEQRTNLLTYSEDYTNPAWPKGGGISIGANAITAPDGTISADSFIETTGTNFQGSERFFTVSIGSTYTFSVFVKAGGRNYFEMYLFGQNNNDVGKLIVDLTTGAAVLFDGPNAAGNNYSYTILNAGNGWWRVSMTLTVVAGSFGTRVGLSGNPSTSVTYGSYAGNGQVSIYLWGAQLEAGAFPTSYIRTVASTVTRSADEASMTGTNFSSWYRQDEGTVYAEMQRLNAASALGYVAGTGNLNTTNSIYGLLNSNGNTQFSSSGGISIVSNSTGAGIKKIGTAYKVNDNAFVINGSVIGTDTSSSIVISDTILFGATFPVASNCGHIRRITYYPLRLTNSQLQTLTV